SLSAGVGEHVTRVEAELASKPDRETGLFPLTEMWHTVTDAWGNALRLSAPAWAALAHVGRTSQANGQISLSAFPSAPSGNSIAGLLPAYGAGAVDNTGMAMTFAPNADNAGRTLA